MHSPYQQASRLSQLLTALAAVVEQALEKAGDGEIERLRDLCREAAPLVARLREQERLTQENAGARQADAVADRERAGLEAIIRMNAHQVRNLLHELRNPLVAIQGYTRLLLEERGGPLTATQREYLAVVQQNTSKLVSAINAAQEAARLGESERLRVETFDVCDLSRESLQSIRAPAAEKSLRIAERIPLEPLLVTGDRQKLARAFRELLAWAVRAAAPGGELLIEVSHTERGEVAMKVSDPTGSLAGAAAAANGASSGMTATGETERIVRLHGGRIVVRGKPGQSSDCMLTLPIVHQAESTEGAHI